MVLWLFNGGNFLCRAQPLHLCTNARCITTPAGGRAEKQTRRLLTTKAPVLRGKRRLLPGRRKVYPGLTLRTPRHIHCLKVDATHTPRNIPSTARRRGNRKKREKRTQGERNVSAVQCSTTTAPTRTEQSE